MRTCRTALQGCRECAGKHARGMCGLVQYRENSLAEYRIGRQILRRRDKSVKILREFELELNENMWMGWIYMCEQKSNFLCEKS